jgi:hypothetical protein
VSTREGRQGATASRSRRRSVQSIRNGLALCRRLPTHATTALDDPTELLIARLGPQPVQFMLKYELGQKVSARGSHP